jgi:hypothetical protein
VKKKNVKITKEVLDFVTVLCYSSLGEVSGLYDKEVFFTPGFAGDVKYLYQLTGNLGGHPRDENLDEDVNYVILSNNTLQTFDSDNLDVFFVDLENKLNQNNSPYRRMKFLSEEQLIQYFDLRIKRTNDKSSSDMLARYRDSVEASRKKNKNTNAAQTLF